MLQRVASSCLPALVAAGVIASVGATAVPAQAATPSAGVTIFLKAPNLAGLQRLATSHGLTHAQRIAALRPLLPSASQRSAAIRALRSAGLDVTGQTAWSISASGSAADVSATFGSHPVMRAHATPAQRRAAAGPYPALPAPLRGIATAAFATSSGPAVFHNGLSGGVLYGPDFRNAYTSTDVSTPNGGSDPKATLTIATVQFSSWEPGDLATWANTPNLGVSGYSASSDLTVVPVDQSSVPTPTSTPDGDDEVDLDQEAILSTDPYAHQRPYFAPNTGAGYFDILSKILDDVTQDSRAYQGGDPHIVAVSTSWGACEADTGHDLISAAEPVLTSLLAAGVTVFAASGDDGIYDQCSTGGANVDYPASSPHVVAVGGTTLSPVGSSSPNSGANWTESAWSCISASNCDDHGGSGGGASGNQLFSGFAKPSYQDSVQNAPFSQATTRMVPDISADADPTTGFPIYTSDPTDNQQAGSGYLVFGGTSLATPVSAALFANALAAQSATSGVGDIHPALYEAATKAGGFRDITVGSNGASTDAGTDPAVAAGTGYDTVSGLGAPLWPKVLGLISSQSTPPTATAKLSLTNVHSGSSPYRVSASWTGTAASGGLDVQHATVLITRAADSSAAYSNDNAPANGSYHFTATPGATYVLSVTARDLAGTASATKTATVVVPIDDKDFSFIGSWKRSHSGSDIAGSHALTSHRNANATVTATGKRYTLVARTGPSFGKLAVIENSAQLRVIDLYSRHSGVKRFTILSAGSKVSRTFKFVCLGKKARASSSPTIAVDGLYVG